MSDQEHDTSRGQHRTLPPELVGIYDKLDEIGRMASTSLSNSAKMLEFAGDIRTSFDDLLDKHREYESRLEALESRLNQ